MPLFTLKEQKCVLKSCIGGVSNSCYTLDVVSIRRYMKPQSLPRMEDRDFAQKRVLIRVDFNVPRDSHGEVTDTMRIDVVLPTILHVLSHGGTPILVSHYGRPDNGPDTENSLEFLVPILEEKLKKTVFFMDYEPREDVLAIVCKTARQEDGVVLLENIRFWPEEESGDEDFASILAASCDVYINEAFSASHRDHASIVALPKLVQEKAAGFYFASEVTAMQRVLDAKEHPIALVLGGAKIDTKIGVVERLVVPCDRFLIGGALANTFLAAKGFDMSDSFFQEDKVDVARKIMWDVEQDKDLLVLPVDVVANHKELGKREVIADCILAGWAAFDIGSQTIRAFERALRDARTIIWNGPLGVCKDGKFTEGTRAVAEAIIARENAFSLVGGGDTIDCLKQMGIDLSGFSHVSTAGGAMLEFLELGTLPGIEALQK